MYRNVIHIDHIDISGLFFFYLIFTCPAMKRNDKMMNDKKLWWAD